MRKLAFPAIAASFMALSACDNTFDVDKAICRMDGDGGVETIDVRTGNVYWSMDPATIVRTDKNHFHGEANNPDGYKDVMSVDEGKKTCTVGTSIDSPSYKLLGPR